MKVSDSDFKKKNRPALCTEDPVMALIPKNKFHEILNVVRQKSRDTGIDYDEGCSKRFVCDGNCTGRQVYNFIPELKPYIKKIEHLIADDGMIYVNKCGNCPIVKTCKSACSQIVDYMDRGKNKEDITNKFNISQVSTDYALGNFVSDDSDPQPGVLAELIAQHGSIQNAIENLPWGAINPKRIRLIRMYIFEGKDFRACAKELNYSNGTVARNEFYRGITTLSRYATVRHFIESHRDEIADLDNELLRLRYYEFLTVSEISSRLNIKVGTVRSRLFRFINRNKLNYSKYVNKNRIVPSSIF